MYEKNLPNRADLTPEFEDGVTAFIEWAKSRHAYIDEAKLGRPLKQMVLFEHCYKKKEDDGWSRPRASKLAEMLQKLMEDHQPQSMVDESHTPAESVTSVAMIEQQMYLAAIGRLLKESLQMKNFLQEFLMARTIQKVPPLLLREEKNRLDYIPKVVSIGPYHHGKPDLRLAEDFKSNAVDLFVSGGTCGRGREFYRAEVAKRIREIKSCYVASSTDEYSDDELVEMMLRDCCFIIIQITMRGCMGVKSG
ncbi:UNVERIFIED_CONTAM: hypothetical protein Sradi_1564000 [Sesamum radiatum]|uniref:Uncharacterized protein n=1 Tax=Sesamum radiatum TaxID=300843 RepID=A0AAW2U904_SESRA